MRASRPIEGKPRAGKQPSPRAEAPDPAILPARRLIAVPTVLP